MTAIATRWPVWMFFVLSILMAFTALPASSDNPLPYHAWRAVSHDGQYYVAIESDARFTYARARESAPRVTAVPFGSGEQRNESLYVQGDLALATGVLAMLPTRVIVSSNKSGFVALKPALSRDGGTCLVVVGLAGTTKHEFGLESLFPTSDIDAFELTTASIHWFRGAWIDEALGQLVIVGNPASTTVVDLKSGAVRRRGARESILRALSLEDPTARSLAVELAGELEMAHAREQLGRILTNELERLAIRLRAVVALKTPTAAAVALFAQAARTPRAKSVSPSAYGFALEHAWEVLGKRSVPVFVDALQMGGQPARGAALRGLRRLGKDAVPTLAKLANSKEAHVDTRVAVLYALARLKADADPALKGVLLLSRAKERSIATAAINAAKEIGGVAVGGKFVALLATPSGHEGQVADYFTEFKHKDAVPALVKALRRVLKGKDWYAKSVIPDALEFQTGAGVGADGAEWVRWFDKKSEKR